MKNRKDTEIFVAIKKGDQKALSVLFLRYYDYLCHYASRITTQQAIVEECIQELFIYIFEAHHKLGEVKFVKAYLFRSLRRRILEKLNKERRLQYTLLGTEELINVSFSAEDLLFQNENEACVRQTLADALNQLSPRQREAIYLRYYNNLSTKEIAEVMGVASQTILNTLHQALKKIRKNENLHRIFKSRVN